MKEYVYRRTVAELQERSCELKRFAKSGGLQTSAAVTRENFRPINDLPTEPDYRPYSHLAERKSNDGFAGETSYTDYYSNSAEQEYDNSRFPKTVTYRLYTEDKSNLKYLTGRYFDGFTLLYAAGVYKDSQENAIIIEIIGTLADLQTIVHLAGDIRVVNAQESVLITWSEVSRLDVTA